MLPIVTTHSKTSLDRYHAYTFYRSFRKSQHLQKEIIPHHRTECVTNMTHPPPEVTLYSLVFLISLANSPRKCPCGAPSLSSLLCCLKCILSVWPKSISWEPQLSRSPWELSYLNPLGPWLVSRPRLLLGPASISPPHTGAWKFSQKSEVNSQPPSSWFLMCSVFEIAVCDVFCRSRCKGKQRDSSSKHPQRNYNRSDN